MIFWKSKAVKVGMDKSLLVRLFGFRATLIHGDTLVLDRWYWLKRRLPATCEGLKFLDVGCGSGAFSMGAALRGYDSLGLSWDERNQAIATDRAKLCNANTAKFEVFDVRRLGERKELVDQFDVVICFENIEHILNDKKLMQDVAACMKLGGRFLLTAPYLLYHPMSQGDIGPFSKTEDGGHVRRGYNKAMLEELCKDSGLVVEEVSYCSGFLSQKVTALQRLLSTLNPLFGWLVILPLRIFPPWFDWIVTKTLRWPYFSICLEAYKPRFNPSFQNSLDTNEIQYHRSNL